MTNTGSGSDDRSAWLPMIGTREALARGGELAEAYMRVRPMGSRPAVYSPPSGDAANIVRCHSLDPQGLALAFGLSTAIHWSPSSLPWATREMINTVTSHSNNCFY
jgi:hypothetical protein